MKRSRSKRDAEGTSATAATPALVAAGGASGSAAPVADAFVVGTAAPLSTDTTIFRSVDPTAASEVSPEPALKRRRFETTDGGAPAISLADESNEAHVDDAAGALHATTTADIVALPHRDGEAAAERNEFGTAVVATSGTAGNRVNNRPVRAEMGAEFFARLGPVEANDEAGDLEGVSVEGFDEFEDLPLRRRVALFHAIRHVALETGQRVDENKFKAAVAAQSVVADAANMGAADGAAADAAPPVAASDEVDVPARAAPATVEAAALASTTTAARGDQQIPTAGLPATGIAAEPKMSKRQQKRQLAIERNALGEADERHTTEVRDPQAVLRAQYERYERIYSRHARTVPDRVARKSEMIAAYRRLIRAGALASNDPMDAMLLRKRGKSHSGVLVVTVLMGPSKFSCPKDCHYCPAQPGIARSYLLKEPGVLRGFRNNWDPIRQFFDRASALENNGHIVDKIEILILGGTFSFYPKEYAEEFIAALFYAANTYHDALPLRPMLGIDEETRINEKARCRIIGVTVETRPDYITRTELVRFRRLGVTRVQIGIQHLDDDVLATVNRECPTSKTVVAIQRLLDAGFKVDAHWMPDLPGSSYEKDLDMFSFLLSEGNEDFQVDQWKVYPTMVVPYTRIEEWYDAGLYKPYAEQNNGRLMVELLVYILAHAPYRLRLNRIVRDIPTTYIKGGERRVNLRQDLEAELQRRGVRCHDIRERECKGAALDKNKSRLFKDVFRASMGTEIYMSVENEGRTTLFGHLRLRLRDDARASNGIVPALEGAALIRELHTYGKLVAVGQHAGAPPGAAQHVGVGKSLVAEAEAEAIRRGFRRMAVISGVGVRGFYASLGYRLVDT